MPNTYPVKDKATSLELSRVENLSKVPTGVVVEYYGSVAPPGWLYLDGTWKEIGDYPVLYSMFKEGSIVPTMYYTTTQFKLPNVPGRIIKT
jgi:hypothetical protein